MGGIYSTEEMEKQMLDPRLLKKAERSTFDRIRIPFKLLCDNATQTDTSERGGARCSCGEGKPAKKDSSEVPDESHINFTSIYLSCHNTPTRCYYDNCVQTDPVDVNSLGVQTENIAIGGFKFIDHNANADVTSDTTESDAYEDTVAYRPGVEQQWALNTQVVDTAVSHNSTVGVRYPGKMNNKYISTPNDNYNNSNNRNNSSVSSSSNGSNNKSNDVVLQLDPIDNKYISSLSSDDDESIDDKQSPDTKHNDLFTQRSSFDKITDNGLNLDNELGRHGSNYRYEDTELFNSPRNYPVNKRGVLGNFDSMKRELPISEMRKLQVMGPAPGGYQSNSWKRQAGNYDGVVRRNKSDVKNNKMWKRYSNIERATNMWDEDNDLVNDLDSKGYLSDDNYTRKRHLGSDYESERDNKQLVKRDASEYNMDRFTDQETGIEEEFEIRHMLDVDYCWKCECLQQENKSMVSKYEHVIRELSDQSEDLMLTDATLNDAINEKEQLQLDLNKAESGLMDAYKRIERLKSALDKYKSNENTMKISLYDFQTKLSKSEERYKKLKRQAIEKVDAANTEIARLQKEKEVQLSSLQAELDKCRNRNMSLEQELEQKSDTNKELSQICDELIKKVSDD